MTAAEAREVIEIERERVQADFIATLKLTNGSELTPARFTIEALFETRLNALAKAMDSLRAELPAPATVTPMKPQNDEQQLRAIIREAIGYLSSLDQLVSNAPTIAMPKLPELIRRAQAAIDRRQA